jgi:hypothetical protein
MASSMNPMYGRRSRKVRAATIERRRGLVVLHVNDVSGKLLRGMIALGAPSGRLVKLNWVWMAIAQAQARIRVRKCDGNALQ